MQSTISKQARAYAAARRAAKRAARAATEQPAPPSGAPTTTKGRPMANPDTRTLYRTAYARIACAVVHEGECVAVRYAHLGDNGVHWYDITATERGPLVQPVRYPEHHLERFCL